MRRAHVQLEVAEPIHVEHTAPDGASIHLGQGNVHPHQARGVECRADVLGGETRGEVRGRGREDIPPVEHARDR